MTNFTKLSTNQWVNPQNYAYISVKMTNLQYCKGEVPFSNFTVWRGLPPIVQSLSVRKDEWPPNLQDLYQLRPTNISELKVALQSIWNDLPQDPIDRSILSFTKQLRACIKANGGQFEHRVWLTNCISLLVATICCTSCSISTDWQHYKCCIVLRWKCTVLRCKFLKCLVTFCWWFW